MHSIVPGRVVKYRGASWCTGANAAGSSRTNMEKQLNRIRWLIAACFLFGSGGTLAEVAFSGLAPELEANARALMPLASVDCDASRWRIQRLYRDAGESLQRALQAKGHYAATFTSTIDWGEECWRAEFQVDAGSPTLYRHVEIRLLGEAEHDREVQAAAAHNRPQAGDALDHGRYESFKRSLLNGALGAGYFDARYERNEVLVDPAAGVADAFLWLSSGPRYHFGALTFTQGIIRESILRGYTDLQPGDHYRAALIDDLYESLQGSSYFESVSISTEPADREAKTVPVNVTLTPAPRRVYSAGAGFATDTGPQGKLGFTNRRLNDSGHQFESRLFGSGVRSEWSASYRWPRSDPRREWFSLAAGFLHEDTDTSEHDTFKLGALYTQNRSRGWLETRYVDYVSEDYSIAGQDSSSQLVIVGVNWESVRGREASRTRNGRRLRLDLRGASDALASDTSFFQARADAKWVHSLDESSRMLMRLGLGMTFESHFRELPASVRYLAGGDQSVRGYGLEDLGPLDEAGQVTGGENLFEASLEYERLFRDRWALALFADTGSAFNGSDIDLSTGVGFGVRWFSPVGPIRFDLAHPLDDPDRTWRIHITLGPDL